MYSSMDEIDDAVGKYLHKKNILIAIDIFFLIASCESSNLSNSMT